MTETLMNLRQARQARAADMNEEPFFTVNENTGSRFKQSHLQTKKNADSTTCSAALTCD